MKQSKKIKGILALSSSVVLALPVLTLTGCSNISQYCIPIATANNPFTVETIQDPYRQSEYGIYSTAENSSYTIQDTKLQIPSSYVYTSEYDGNFLQKRSNDFGFTNFNTPEWKTKGPEGTTGLDNKYQFSRKSDNDIAWRSPKGEQLAYTISDGRLSSYQNLNICSAIETVNSTSYSFINTFTYMNTYLNRIISQKKESDIQEYLSYIFSGNKTDGFDYGSDDQAKSRFYEYCLDNANLISTASTKYKFGPYNVNWTFNDTGIIADNVFKNKYETGGFGEVKNPFIGVFMKDLTKGEYGEVPSGNTPWNEGSQFEFPTNNDFTGWYVGKESKQEFDYHAPIDGTSVLNPYVKYTYKDGSITDFSSIMPIPMLISPSYVQSAFYDPSSNNSSIQPADWLTRSGELPNIQKQIKQDGAWDAVKKNVSLPDLTATTLTYAQNTSNNEQPSASNIYGSWMSTDMKKAYDENKIDCRVKDWIDNGKIKFGDWVALANYGVLTITFKYEYYVGTKPAQPTVKYIKALLPYFSGFSAIFPAYMLFTNNDCYKQINPDAKNKNPEKNYYYINYSGSGIEKDFNNMMKTINSTTLPDVNKTYATTYEMMKNDPYMLYTWTFGKLAEGAENYDYVANRGKVIYSDILKDAA